MLLPVSRRGRRAAIVAGRHAPDGAVFRLPDDHRRGAALVAAVAGLEQRHVAAADLDGAVVVEDVAAGELVAVEGKHLVQIFALGDRQRAALERDRRLRLVLRRGGRSCDDEYRSKQHTGGGRFHGDLSRRITVARGIRAAGCGTMLRRGRGAYAQGRVSASCFS